MVEWKRVVHLIIAYFTLHHTIFYVVIIGVGEG